MLGAYQEEGYIFKLHMLIRIAPKPEPIFLTLFALRAVMYGRCRAYSVTEHLRVMKWPRKYRNYFPLYRG